MSASTLSVVKFGGSSLRTMDDYGRVAEHIELRLSDQNARLVVVVSAMHGVTDRLVAMITELNPRRPPRSLDDALITGEILSAALLVAALDRRGLPSEAILGHALGIRTDSCHGQARIISVNPRPLMHALERSRVVVVPGAQGADATGVFTTLGRNSSDLTAVAIASALELAVCEIYSKVPAVFTADPAIVRAARPLRSIPYSVAAQMSRLGAKVLHYRCVEWAQRHSVQIVSASLERAALSGTVVGLPGDACVVAIACNACQFRFRTTEDCQLAKSLLLSHDVATSDACVDSQAVIVPCDGAFAIDHLQWAGLQLRSIDPVVLVSQISSVAASTFIVDDQAAAVRLAEDLHDRMYSEAPALSPLHEPAGEADRGAPAQSSETRSGLIQSRPVLRPSPV